MEQTNNPKFAILHHKLEELLKKHLPENALQLSLDDTITLVQKLEEKQMKILALKKKLRLAKEQSQFSIQKYNELIGLMPLGYLILSGYGEIIKINTCGSRLLGKELIYLVNSDFRLYITDETKPIFDIFLRNIFCNQTDETCGVTLLSPDNLPIYVHLSGHVTKNGEQCIVSMVDITEKKQMIADLIKAKEKTEESDRLKSAFLANMSHEIRTPMNGILGFTDLLKEPNLSDELQQEYISAIEKSSTRLLDVINDIIEISKIESGLIKISDSETNINEQTKLVYNCFKHQVRQKGINFSIKNTLQPQDVMIRIDKEKIWTILSNLLKNAIKFTWDGSIEFGYKKKGGYLEFFVKDTGTGIQKEHVEIIFERFRQGNESLSRYYEGIGLGLTITKAYVEILGGKIWVESEANKGSTFFFTIPYINCLRTYPLSFKQKDLQ